MDDTQKLNGGINTLDPYYITGFASCTPMPRGQEGGGAMRYA